MPTFRKMSHCLICGERTPRSRNYKDACSSKCYNELMGLRRQVLEHPVTCLRCGDIYYKTKLNGSKYCSKECRNPKSEISINSKDFSIFHRDKFTCIYCGKSAIEDGVKLHVDHITAILTGGISEINNLITSCQECNLCKNGNELEPDVKYRIIKVLLERNKNLSIQQFSIIEKEVELYQRNDNSRFMSLSFNKRKRVKEKQLAQTIINDINLIKNDI